MPPFFFVDFCAALGQPLDELVCDVLDATAGVKKVAVLGANAPAEDDELLEDDAARFPAATLFLGGGAFCGSKSTDGRKAV